MRILKPRAAAKAAQPPETPPPAIEPDERYKLAKAIETRNHIQRELEATTKALADLDTAGSVRVAAKAVQAAKVAIETAKSNAAAFMSAAIGGATGEPPMSIKDARAALQAAEDHLETQIAVQASLRAKKDTEQEALSWAKATVKKNIEAVVRADPSLRKLLAEFEEMKRLMAQRAALFSFLFLMIPDEFRHWQGTRQYRPNELQDETQPWRAALAELEHNSEAPLPSLTNSRIP